MPLLSQHILLFCGAFSILLSYRLPKDFFLFEEKCKPHVQGKVSFAVIFLR